MPVSCSHEPHESLMTSGSPPARRARHGQVPRSEVRALLGGLVDDHGRLWRQGGYHLEVGGHLGVYLGGSASWRGRSRWTGTPRCRLRNRL